MFLETALIRKNTKELRNKLEKLGYICLNSNNTTIDAHNFDGKGNHKYIDEGTAIITYEGGYYGIIYAIDSVTTFGRYDCGDNESLFLAIVALRNDSDRNQWFIADNDPTYIEMTEDDLPSRYMQMQGHKMSVEELFKYFSNVNNKKK